MLGLFYLSPEWNELQKLRRETKDLADISGEFDTLIQNRDALVDQINTLSQNDLGRIDRALPEGPKASEFLVSIEALARKHGLVMRRIDIASVETKAATGGQPRPAGTPTTPPQSTGPITELPINLSLVGNYEAFKGFLVDLEKNLRIIDTGDISFSAAGGAFDFSIKTTTYYQ